MGASIGRARRTGCRAERRQPRRASAMLRPRRNWTRGVAAQHASLSRWRSPVRIRSGPPSPHFPTPRPPARTGRSSVRRAAHLGPILCHTPPRDSTPRAHRRRSRARGARGGAGRVAARARRRRRRRRRRAAERLAGRGRSATADADADARPSAAAGADAEPPAPADRPATPARRPPSSSTCRSSRSPTSARRSRRHRPRTWPRSWPARAARYDDARARRERGAGDPRRARRRRRRSGPHRHVRRRAGPRHGPRQEPQAPRVPARRRGRAGGPCPDLGRQGAVRRRSRQGPRRLAADRAARPPRPPADAYDPATTWTLFAGGDIMLDRGVYLTLKTKGADFPFDGGTAEITGRCKDCSPLGWDTPYTQRTGNAGVVRDLIEGRRHRRRQLREPGARQPALPRLGHHLLGRPAVHRRPRRTPASTTSRSPTTTSATPAAPGCSRRSRT